VFEVVPLPKTPRRKRKKRNLFLRFFLWGSLGILCLVVAGAGGGGYYLYTELHACSLNGLHSHDNNGQTSFIYASNGSLLGAIPSITNRQVVPLAQISPWLRKATISIEDRRFYQHGGVDYRGLVRAAWIDLKTNSRSQGGSTLSQQLVRQLYLSRAKTLKRKLKEACLAIKLNKAWGKQRILSEYLNRVYYGARAYGVQAAARTYFSRPANRLTLVQAATIAGLPQAPTQYNPLIDPEAATRRRNEVLQSMLDTKAITLKTYQAAVKQHLGLRPGKVYTRHYDSLVFNYVYDQLVSKYGAEGAQRGGLKVYTTINPSLQRLAYKSITDTLYSKDDPAAAVVSIDPRNGHIKTMAARAPGGHNLVFNLVAQGKRQPGSTFKTFVLAEAIRRGIDPDHTTYLSGAFTYSAGLGATPWEVHTDDYRYYGYETLHEAIVHSDNTVFARLILDLGPAAAARMAHRLGVKTALPPFPSLTLGSVPVTPLEMASAYATIASGGIYHDPTAIREVIGPDGSVDRTWGEPKGKRVVPYSLAYAITQALKDNVARGTGTAAQIGRPQAGKTGTTSDLTDAWFIGYVPQLTTAVWVGYPHRNISMRNVHGIEVFGGTFPAQIWQRYMSPALSGMKPLDWPYPRIAPQYTPWQGTFQYKSYGSSSDIPSH
jgi:penicillin-binding protein 1A